MRVLIGAYDGALKVMWLLAMVILPATALIITYEVVLRYFFNRPTIWAIDLAAFALLWITFLASPWLVRHNGHITIEFVTARLRPKVRFYLRGVVYFLAAGVSYLLFWYGWNAAYQALIRGVLTHGSWEIPRGYVWIVIPLGSLFLIIEFLRGSVLSFVEARRAGSQRPAAEESIDEVTDKADDVTGTL